MDNSAGCSRSQPNHESLEHGRYPSLRVACSNLIFVLCGGHPLERVQKIDPLRIPELLINILELTDRREQSVAARVCRRWSDPALEVLWKDLLDLWPFLQLLVIIKNAEVLSSAFTPKSSSSNPFHGALRCHRLRNRNA